MFVLMSVPNWMSIWNQAVDVYECHGSVGGIFIECPFLNRNGIYCYAVTFEESISASHACWFFQLVYLPVTSLSKSFLYTKMNMLIWTVKHIILISKMIKKHWFLYHNNVLHLKIIILSHVYLSFKISGRV